MPSRTAPHRPLASTPHVPCTIHPSVHFSTPHHCFLSWPQLPTLSSYTAPSSSCSITTHMLLLPPVLAHCAISMVSWTPLSLPCLLQDLHSPGGPLLPRPFRLQLSPGSPLPPPLRGPLRACCLSSCCLFISAHSCSHVGLFLGGTEPFCTAAPGRAGGSEREHNQETEESEVVRGLLGPGAWESRGM